MIHIYSGGKIGGDKIIKKRILILFLSIIFIVLLFSGCFGSSTTTEEKEKPVNIKLKSSVVRFADNDLVYNKDNNIIKSVEAKYLFHNIIDKIITIRVTAEFYDKDNNLLATGGPKEISLQPRYTEIAYTGANSIFYSGEFVDIVDNVVIIADQI